MPQPGVHHVDTRPPRHETARRGGRSGRRLAWVSPDQPQPGTYIHGHAPSVLASHGARTAASSAAYLLPHLRHGMRVLDIGCGPGTITLDLAEAVGPGGRVVGIEPVEGPLETARANAAARGDRHTEFALGDVHDLGRVVGDEQFDVVHAHQVLQHLTDPVGALRAMASICRPGGLVAARDIDYATMTWHPASDGMTDWLATYRDVARRAGGEPDAGRRMLSWAHAAGLADAQVGSSTWTYGTDEARRWWGEGWADRVMHSTFAQQCDAAGVPVARREEMRDAWLEWSRQPDGWFVMVHGELLAHPAEES